MKSYKYIGMAMLTAVTLSGCSDFLDTENKSNANQNGEEFFKRMPKASSHQHIIHTATSST